MATQRELARLSLEKQAQKKQEKKAKQQAYYRKNIHKYKAVGAIARAIKKGILPPVKTLTCRVPNCGFQAEEYHHWSYQEKNWLSVIPVCCFCHDRIHAGQITLKRPKSLAVTAKGDVTGR